MSLKPKKTVLWLFTEGLIIATMTVHANAADMKPALNAYGMTASFFMSWFNIWVNTII